MTVYRLVLDRPFQEHELTTFQMHGVLERDGEYYQFLWFRWTPEDAKSEQLDAPTQLRLASMSLHAARSWQRSDQQDRPTDPSMALELRPGVDGSVDRIDRFRNKEGYVIGEWSDWKASELRLHIVKALVDADEEGKDLSHALRSAAGAAGITDRDWQQLLKWLDRNRFVDGILSPRLGNGDYGIFEVEELLPAAHRWLDNQTHPSPEPGRDAANGPHALGGEPDVGPNDVRRATVLSLATVPLERPDVLDEQYASALPTTLEGLLLLADTMRQNRVWADEFDLESIVNRRIAYLSDYQGSPAYDNHAEQLIAEAQAAHLAELIADAVAPSVDDNPILESLRRGAHELAATDGSNNDIDRARTAVLNVASAVDQAAAGLDPDQLQAIADKHPSIDHVADIDGSRFVEQQVEWIADASETLAEHTGHVTSTVLLGTAVGTVLGAAGGAIGGTLAIGPAGNIAGAEIGMVVGGSIGTALATIAATIMAIASRYRPSRRHAASTLPTAANEPT